MEGSQGFLQNSATQQFPHIPQSSPLNFHPVAADGFRHAPVNCVSSPVSPHIPDGSLAQVDYVAQSITSVTSHHQNPPTPISVDSKTPPAHVLPQDAVHVSNTGMDAVSQLSSFDNGYPTPAHPPPSTTTTAQAAGPATATPSNAHTRTSSRKIRNSNESSSDSSDSSSDESYTSEDSQTHQRVKKRRKRAPLIDPETGNELPRIRPAYYYDSNYVPDYPHPRRPDDVPPRDPVHKWTKKGKPPHSQRGIPVFMPSMEEFRDFYTFIKAVDRYGMRSGIVKVIPPTEWSDRLPNVKEPLKQVRIREPIDQTVYGTAGTFKYTNIAKTKQYNVKQFKDLSELPAHMPPDFFKLGRKNETEKKKLKKSKTKEEGEAASDIMDDFKDDGLSEKVQKGIDGSVPLGTEMLDTSSTQSIPPESAETVVNPGSYISDVSMQVDTKPTITDSPDEAFNDNQGNMSSSAKTSEVFPIDLSSEMTGSLLSQIKASLPPNPSPSNHPIVEPTFSAATIPTGAPKRKRKTQAELTEIDDDEWEKWDYERLPYGAMKEMYTQEACRDIERAYWRTLNLNDTPAMYGADLKGSLFTDETKEWNVAHLESFLTELIPRARRQIPGVNTPYLYFGMWKATFAWHVEDCDLYSINYLHFGAPKFWYAIPQGKGDEHGGAGGGMGGKERFERVMAGLFPGQDTKCSQFLRHKAFSASPTKLAESGIKLNRCVQLPGEFILTYPNGYHSGFNTGFNCAESVNFATRAWLDLGRKALSCKCMKDSVSIDVDAMIRENAEWQERQRQKTSQPLRKRPYPSSNGSRASSVAVTPLLTRPHDQQYYTQKRPRIENRQRDMSTMSMIDPALHGNQGEVYENGPQKVQNAQVQQMARAVVGGSLQSPSQQKTALPQQPIPKPLPVPKKEYICALCTDLTDDNLVPIREPGKRSVGVEKKAHRVCVMFTPATWIEQDPMTKEDIVRGFGQIERARWSLKCGLCNEKHGAPVQCTKGKCVRAFHASCALREDSGVVLDAIVGEGENAKSMIVDAAKEGEGIPIDQPAGELRTVILCRQHNPDWKRMEAERKATELETKIDGLTLESRIRVRTGGGVFEVKLRAINRDRKTVSVEFDDGQKSELKYSTVQFTQPRVSTLGSKRKRLDPDFILEFEDDSDEDWVGEGAPKKRNKPNNKIAIHDPAVPYASQAQATPVAGNPAYPAQVQNPYFATTTANAFYNYSAQQPNLQYTQRRSYPPQMGQQIGQHMGGYNRYSYTGQPPTHASQAQMVYNNGQPAHPQTLPGIANLLSAANQQPQQQYVSQTYPTTSGQQVYSAVGRQSYPAQAYQSTSQTSDGSPAPVFTNSDMTTNPQFGQPNSPSL